MDVKKIIIGRISRYDNFQCLKKLIAIKQYKGRNAKAKINPTVCTKINIIGLYIKKSEHNTTTIKSKMFCGELNNLAKRKNMNKVPKKNGETTKNFKTVTRSKPKFKRKIGIILLGKRNIFSKVGLLVYSFQALR
ncbi:MAG: hypothetical protein WC356_05220 [Candidatus Micrarchaeia archaeon]